jgi:hypothetical protein
MGQIVLPPSGSVYVDTNAVIFRVQLIEPHLTASDPLWKALRARTCQVVTSNLTLMEVLVKPIRDGGSGVGFSLSARGPSNCWTILCSCIIGHS